MKSKHSARLLVYSKAHPMLITAFIIIGILATVLIVVVWFTPLSDSTVTVSSTIPAPLGSEAFYTAISSIAHSPVYPIADNEPVQILNNGDEFVPDLLSEIKNAKHSITLADYIWKKGTLTDEIFDAVTEKAKEGVKVRIFMDAFGGLQAPSDKIKALEKAGGVVIKFRPLGFRTLTRLNKRTHLRAMVIDGKVGYIGGFAFDDEWLGNGTQPKEWRDVMFKFTGYGARSIQNMFADLWRETDGEILTGSDFYPTLPDATIGDDCKTSCFVPLFQVPTPDLEKNLYQFFWLSIMGAKDHIYLETPYLLPSANVLKALEEKAKEGVDVEIIVPGPYVDSKIVQLASRSYYKEILDAGIKIYEYQPAHLHSKVMTADGEWSIVGSANLDNRSSTLNVEGIMGVEDKTLAQGIEIQFNLDKSRSVEVTKDTFTTNILDRLFGTCSRLFAKQY